VFLIRSNLPQPNGDSAEGLIPKLWIAWILEHNVIGFIGAAHAVKEQLKIGAILNNLEGYLLRIGRQRTSDLRSLIIDYADSERNNWIVANTAINITWGIYNAIFPLQLGIFSFY
jgi:hypothetical protein